MQPATPSQRAGMRDDSGAAAVEFGLGMMLLAVILVGTFEVGRAMWHHHVIVKAVRDGTRYLARVDDPRAPGAQTVATNLALRGTTDPDAPMVLSDPDNPVQPPVALAFTITDFDNSGGLYSGAPAIPVIRGTATHPYHSPLLRAFGIVDGLTITATHVERHTGL